MALNPSTIIPQLLGTVPYLTSGGRNVSNAAVSSSSNSLNFAPVISVGSAGNLSPSASGSSNASGSATAVPDYLSPGGGYGSPGLPDIYDIDDQAAPPALSGGDEFIPGIPDWLLLAGAGGVAWFLLQGSK